MFAIIITFVALCADQSAAGFKIIHEKLPTAQAAPAAPAFKIVYEELPKAVAEAKAPVVRQIIFGATWCGYCPKEGDAVVKALREAKWVVGSTSAAQIQLVDYDQNPELAQKYGVSSLPTYVLVSDDKVVSKHVGRLTAVEIADHYYRKGRFAQPARQAAAAATPTLQTYKYNWPGDLTEKSLREHLQTEHKLDTKNMSFREMIDWHDAWHVLHPEVVAPNHQARRRGKRY